MTVEGAASSETAPATWSRYYDVLEEAHEIVLRPEASRMRVLLEPVMSFIPHRSGA